MSDINPLPELPKEDPYYTHCRTQIDQALAESQRQREESERRVSQRSVSRPLASSGGDSTLAKILGWIGLVLLGLYGWSQTEHWTGAALYGVVGLIIGYLVGGILHFIYTHLVATMVVAGAAGYLYFSNYLAPFGVYAPQ